ncbi:MAG: hypothetical protein ACYDCO_27350 [Armatimonadota bacterium]
MILAIRETCPDAREAARILAERLVEIPLPDGEVGMRLSLGGGDGFVLTCSRSEVVLTASRPREFVAGVGRLLSLLREHGGMPEGMWTETPRLPVRVHYMPAHFGNPYEVMWPGEMQRYLEDLALWGASGYSDWFDPNDMPDPYNPHVYCSASMTLWQRKKDFLRRAKALGLDTGIYVAHNVGFLDQLRPEWLGIRSHQHRVQGQVLCPSIPKARAVCLRNHENLFADLAASGVQLDRLVYGPYDDGGCACDLCQPYYPTFLGMVTEIHEIARRYFPGIRADLCGWWVSEEEIQQIKAFAAGPAKDWINEFQISVSYEAFGSASVTAADCGLPASIFFHIGYSHDKRDVYLATGAHAAPQRIQHTFRRVTEHGLRGFNTYNESFGDHYNQFLSTRLARDPNADLEALTRDYCRQMYGLRGAELDEMVALLHDMQFLEGEKAEDWAAMLERLQPSVTVPPRQPWAFEHVALKAQLLALDHRIGTGAAWQCREDLDPVLPLIEKRLDLSERLWRTVYGLGILRHIFVPDFMWPIWHRRYTEFYPEYHSHITLHHERVSKRA